MYTGTIYRYYIIKTELLHVILSIAFNLLLLNDVMGPWVHFFTHDGGDLTQILNHVLQIHCN